MAHELRVVFPDTPSRWVCTETIYQAVYRPDLGGLSRELPERVLRRRRRQRVADRHALARRPQSTGQMVPITHRPATVLERVEPGHWEGDLIVGSGNKSAIVTLVERTTRYTLLGPLPGRFHGAETARDAVVAELALIPAHLRRTLTWDLGSEMALHEKITRALDLPVYFADPHSPWQRPTNENTADSGARRNTPGG
ncbi:MAG: IS30 family transposase [Cellulomonas sp.]